jgi:putative ABC transport system permease protein
VVIGVIRDFVLEDPSKDPPPVVVYLSKENLGHLFVRISNSEHWRDCLAKIETVIKETSPEFPFEFQFTDKEYQEEFQQVEAMGQMGNIFGGMAILISCLGLFGLSAYLVERRGKEISIRKVLGAGSGALWFSLSKEFLMPVVVAFVIAAPISGLLMGKVLGMMDYHITLSWWIFAVAGVVALMIALATVSFNGVKAAVAKPIDRLRAE